MVIIIYCDKYRDLSDIEYIDEILAGNNEAEACFREIYIDRLVNFIVFKKLYWLKPSLEDICQEIWLNFKEKNWKILVNFKNLQTPEPLKLQKYIGVAICRFIANNCWTKFGPILFPQIFGDKEKMEEQKRVFAVPLSSDDKEDIDIAAPESDWPENIVEYNDVLNRLENLVKVFFSNVIPEDRISKAGLNEREQRIVRLKCVANLSSKEIGCLLEMTPEAVDTALSRAKKKIRDYYKEEGLWNDVMEALRDAED